MLAIFELGVLSTASEGTSISGEALNVFKVFEPVAAADGRRPCDIAAGAAAVGIFMAFWSWVGFEMAPNYAEELRDPKRIIPLSLLHLGDRARRILHRVELGRRIGLPDRGRHARQDFSTDSGNTFLTPIENSSAAGPRS